MERKAVQDTKDLTVMVGFWVLNAMGSSGRVFRKQLRKPDFQRITFATT